MSTLRRKETENLNAWIYVVIVARRFRSDDFVGRYNARNTAGAARTEAATGSSIRKNRSRCYHSKI